MPLLAREIDLYPHDVLDRDTPEERANGCRWWALYTLSRREKDLMRRLVDFEIPFYGPVIEKRVRSPQGRLRTSFQPLFSNYVFIYGGDEDRYTALTTGCVSRYLPVGAGDELVRDLCRIRDLIQTGAPVTIEEKLQPGTLVRVRSGALAGQEGVIIERRGRRRLLVAVNFLQQGASVELDDVAVEKL
ncbi:MAG TPA: transcription termination/antitermination NusG family protein [Planctomycetaceae bacterium]|nr:transcription termination/antitermination NusG family protein [Planctomycetaceae bacterium]